MTNSNRDLTPSMVKSLTLDTSPYLSCDECFSRIDKYVEKRIAEPGYVDRRFEVHLAGCEACAEEAHTLTELLSYPED